MASESKLAKKAEQAMAKLKDARGENRDLSKLAGKMPAPVLPLIGAFSTYVTGYGDAVIGTAQNKNPATMAAAALSFVGSLAAAFMGHPTAGQGAAAVATATIGALTHDRGYEMGQKSRAPAG